MDRNSSGVAIASTLVIAIVSATTMLAPTFRGDDPFAVTTPEQMSKDRANTTPIVLAQGRCFNGRCFGR
jgi:hypothetical protein